MVDSNRALTIGPELAKLTGPYPPPEDVLEAVSAGQREKAILARLWVSEGIPFALFRAECVHDLRSAQAARDALHLRRRHARRHPGAAGAQSSRVRRHRLQLDETTVQVLKEPGKALETKSQLWAMMSPGPEPPIVVFEYDRPARAMSPDGCWRGSAVRCTPMATAATARRCANTTWCTWSVGAMPDADSPTC